VWLGLSNVFTFNIEQKISKAEIVVDNDKVATETKAYQKKSTDIILYH
jgi:hypothetical protein